MAYMGRGGFSSSFGANVGSNNGRSYYRGGLIRLHYYIPLDNTYVIFQMIVTFIIIIVAGIVFLTTYKSSINDPIEDIKNIIVNLHMGIMLGLIIITFLASYFSKNKKSLVQRLFVILLITIISLITFFGTKIVLNSTYNKSKFEQIYEEQYVTENSDNNKKVDISFTYVKIKTEKEYFVDECMKMYNIFNIKTYGIIGLNILLMILLLYQVAKVSNIQYKEEQLLKDDEVLFDEEENVKI